jgi:exonuclease VII small subunit
VKIYINRIDVQQMQFFKLIPLETWLSICFLVILPSVLAGFLRFSLHTRLEEINKLVTRLLSDGDPEGRQPHIVDRLRERYQKASQKLEHVNTIALIDSIYKEETISYWIFKNIQYDRAESITRVLPNLLIAFGLVGTFLGITTNLTSISSIVTEFNTNSPNTGSLIQGLRQPLQSMGVAFSASLFGILFGSILTIVNTYYNTGIAKYQLIASLEDYLDNIYKPTVEGNTRLDKAIERMADKQTEFLINFHRNVGQILEITFGKAANQIAEECGRINHIAENIYTNFSNAAGAISTGASTFQYAANSLESQTKSLVNSMNQLQSGVETFKIAATQIEQNNLVQNLDRILIDLNSNQQAFANSTQILQNSLTGIIGSNLTAAQLAQQVYETWQDSATKILAASETISTGAITFQQTASSLDGQTQALVELMPELKTGIDTFVLAANDVKTNNIINDLNTLVSNLSDTQTAFANSTQTLTTGVAELITNNQENNQLAAQVYHGLETYTEGINLGASKLLDVAQSIQDSQHQFEIVLNKSNEDWQTSQTEFTKSTAIFSEASKQIEPVVEKLDPTIVSINKAVDTLQQVGAKIVSFSENNLKVSNEIQSAIANFDRQHQTLLNNTESSLQRLIQDNQLTRQELRDILDRIFKLSIEKI